MIHLKDRAILEISGEDSRSFLQGLITNDINKANQHNLIYSAMLNSQGRFLYDFFIFEKDGKIFLDCFYERRDEILKKLNFYKLRAKVLIAKNEELAVFSSNENKYFIDPRSPNMGYRAYLSINQNAKDESIEYHYRRICLKIPESEHDLTYEKSIIAEFDFDNLNAVDYQKGCYVGQELTARTHYMGQVRKKIMHVTLTNLQKIEKNCEISCDQNSIGIILSSCFYKNSLHALALVKTEDINLENCSIKDHETKISWIN